MQNEQNGTTDQVRLEARLQELNSRLGDNNPQVIEARANLAELKLRIDTEVSKVSSSLGIANNINQQRYGDVRTAFETQRARILQMKALRDEGAVLLRDVESAQRTYDQITQRLNQATLESMANQSNVSVLSQALPPISPSSPRVFVNLFIAVFIGGLLAMAVVVAKEMKDRRVRSVEDVFSAVQLPVIGILPSTKQSRFFKDRAQSPIQSRLLGQAVPVEKEA